MLQGQQAPPRRDTQRPDPQGPDSRGLDRPAHDRGGSDREVPGREGAGRGGAGRDAAGREDEARPVPLIVVTTWDMVLATLALLDAFAVFAGHRVVNDRTVDIPTAVQIFQALAYAALAVALFLIGTLLITRRSGWVRRAQMIVLVMAVVLTSVSLAVTLITDQSARDLATVVISATVMLIDLAVVAAMMGQRVRAWFDESGEVPLYLGALIAFWAAASAAFFVLGLSEG